MKRLLVLLALAAAAAFALPGAVRADGGDNVAIAINTRDGASVFRLAFKVRRVMGDVVDESNAAVAYSSCTSCQTSAIAIQVVLAMGDPNVWTPENLAIAVNEGCSLCETYAGAFQLALGTGGVVRFTTEGNRQIAEIRRLLNELRRADLTPAELDARVQALADRLFAVVQESLVPVGPTPPAPAAGEPAPSSASTDAGTTTEPVTATTTDAPTIATDPPTSTTEMTGTTETTGATETATAAETTTETSPATATEPPATTEPETTP